MKNLLRLVIWLNFVAILTLTFEVAWQSDLLDFQIYYGAAKLIVNGYSPYATFGLHQLPYQYFLWFVLWFIPLTIFPIQTAWWVYVGLNLFLLALSVIYLTRRLWDRLEFFPAC